MIDRGALWAGVGILALGLLGPGTALATVKCQCNDGSITEDVEYDYDDQDVDLDAACNDACSMSGGGRLWNVDADRDDDGGGTRRLPPRNENRDREAR